MLIHDDVLRELERRQSENRAEALMLNRVITRAAERLRWLNSENDQLARAINAFTVMIGDVGALADVPTLSGADLTIIRDTPDA